MSEFIHFECKTLIVFELSERPVTTPLPSPHHSCPFPFKDCVATVQTMTDQKIRRSTEDLIRISEPCSLCLLTYLLESLVWFPALSVFWWLDCRSIWLTKINLHRYVSSTCWTWSVAHLRPVGTRWQGLSKREIILILANTLNRN